MANWKDRLREEITLLSPAGKEFVARWTGGARTLKNKVGIHEFPGIAGARVQDLRAGADIWPLTIFFNGDDNDTDADEFIEELKGQTGKWQVDHPVKGPIFVIWTDATENIEPVESGGLTSVQVNFITPLPESEAESLAQAQAQAEFQADQLNATASQQFQANALQNTAGQKQSIISSVGKAITKIKSKLRAIENTQIIDPQLVAIGESIQATLDSDIIDTSALAGQMQAYVQIFTLGQTEATEAVQMFSDFVTDVLTDTPEQASEEGRSQTAVTELVATAGLTAAGQSCLIGGISSKSQSITTAELMADILENVTNGLDSVQELYQDNTIDRQYFSQSQTYADALLQTALSNRFLLISLFGLPSERRKTLTEDKSTPQIVKEEYGNIGFEGNEIGYLEIFLESNKLMDDDIYFLKAGREILIYN